MGPHTERPQLTGEFKPEAFLLRGDSDHHCTTVLLYSEGLHKQRKNYPTQKHWLPLMAAAVINKNDINKTKTYKISVSTNY